MNNTLHLNLKYKWFKMIFLGIKKEEYRALTPYWDKRLCNIGSVNRSLNLIFNGKLPENTFKEWDTITFSNGYSRDRPQFEIEFKGIEIREGNPEWGAEPGKKYFVLKLGDILNDRNCARFVLENMEG